MNLTRRTALATLTSFAGSGVMPAMAQRPPSGTALTTALQRPDAAEEAAMDRHAENFRSSFKLPGLSVAIAYRGAILFEKGYGQAFGSNPATQGACSPTPQTGCVTTGSLFRIASVSKPITAVTILDLIERPAPSPAPRLSLDDKVFGPNGILDSDFSQTPCDSRFKDITVKQLLNHTAGCPGGYFNWYLAGPNTCVSDMTQTPSNRPNTTFYQATDPMFALKYKGLSRHDLITAVLRDMRLEFDPGTKYDYSNFGYLLLGRVIEKCAPQPARSYEHVVQERIFSLLGMSEMRIAQNLLSQRQTREVQYYQEPSDDPYNIDVERMDSHGGWIATASDLAKFAWHGVDLLNDHSKLLMTTPSNKPDFNGNRSTYGLGWAIDQRCDINHAGSLPGTSSYLKRTASEFTWAALANHRDAANQYWLDLSLLGEQLILNVPGWSTQFLSTPTKNLCSGP